MSGIVTDTPIAPSEGFGALRQDIDDSRAVAEPPKRGRHPNACTCERCKARRAAPPKTVSSTAPVVLPEIIPPEVFTGAVSFAFEIIAKRKGAHWELSKDEKEQVGKLAARVVAKWSPEWLARFSDELSLAAILGMAIMTRMMLDARLASDRAAEEAAREGTGGAVPLPS